MAIQMLKNPKKEIRKASDYPDMHTFRTSYLKSSPPLHPRSFRTGQTHLWQSTSLNENAMVAEFDTARIEHRNRKKEQGEY